MTSSLLRLGVVEGGVVVFETWKNPKETRKGWKEQPLKRAVQVHMYTVTVVKLVISVFKSHIIF